MQTRETPQAVVLAALTEQYVRYNRAITTQEVLHVAGRQPAVTGTLTEYMVRSRLVRLVTQGYADYGPRGLSGAYTWLPAGAPLPAPAPRPPAAPRLPPVCPATLVDPNDRGRALHRGAGLPGAPGIAGASDTPTRNRHGVLVVQRGLGRFVRIDRKTGESIPEQGFPTCDVPVICLGCTHYEDGEFGEMGSRLSPPYCNQNIWFPVAAGTCRRRKARIERNAP